MKTFILEHKKPISAGLVVLLAFGLMLTTKASDDTDFTTTHNQIDEQLTTRFNSWVQANGMRDFCLPKASLLTEEISVRTKLGDDTTQLQERLNRVTNKCTETVKQVLF